VGEYLGQRLELRLKHPAARVLSCAGHLDALGARITRGGIGPSPAHWRRMRAAIGAYTRGETTRAFLTRSLVGRWGSASLG
jgi:hypothetical protein